MIFILEGPDGAGKSTLATLLSNLFDMEIIHHSYPRTEDAKLLMVNQYKALLETHNNIIIDRCWYSEMVYGPVKRNEFIVSFYDMYHLELLARDKGAVIIYCTTDFEMLAEVLETRGDDYIKSKEELKKIWEGYEHLFNDHAHHLEIIRYRKGQLDGKLPTTWFTPNQ